MMTWPVQMSMPTDARGLHPEARRWLHLAGNHTRESTFDLVAGQASERRVFFFEKKELKKLLIFAVHFPGDSRQHQMIGPAVAVPMPISEQKNGVWGSRAQHAKA
jgi:hypothetical protein